VSKGNFLLGAVAAAVVLAGVAAYMQALTGGPTGPDPDNPEVVALGKTVYDANCAECHGANLEGEPNWRVKKPDGTLPAPPHDETGHTWHHADDLLFDITKRGGAAVAPEGFKSGMPPFADVITDAEIWAVLSFIKSRWPAPVRKRQERMSERSG